MKKLLLIIFITVVSISFTQTTDARQRGLKNPPGKTFFRDPGEFNGKEVPFKISVIKFETAHKEQTSSNSYGILFVGKVNGNIDRRVFYKAASIEEMAYYRDVLRGEYKKILVFVNDYKNSACKNNKCYTTAINVEF